MKIEYHGHGAFSLTPETPKEFGILQDFSDIPLHMGIAHSSDRDSDPKFVCRGYSPEIWGSILSREDEKKLNEKIKV